jgi:polyphosphate kinase 2 (PPK2 family)
MKKIFLWGGVIALVICTLSFFIGTKVNATDSKDKTFIGAEKHEIALSEGLQLVANFRKNSQAPKNQGGSFERGAFEKILAQPGCEKIKFYWARENGKFTVVLVGVDAAGKDMISGSIMEKSGDCPPNCDITSPFTMGTLALQR